MNVKDPHTPAAFVVSLCIAAGWLFITFILSIEYAGALDSPQPDVPMWLRLSDAIVWFPLDCLTDLSKNPSGMSSHATGTYFAILWVLNSLFWGFFLVSLYRRVVRRSVAA
jgi:hypothetical protein